MQKNSSISDNALVSVIMPCYDADQFLDAAINSILKQTYNNLEFIIIDDCSNDHSAQIIKKHMIADNRIIYIKNQRNLGIVPSLNKGILIARGEFIARMDADDISDSERLARQVDYMQKNENCIVCGTNMILIDKDGTVIGLRKYTRDSRNIKKQILEQSPFAHPSTMIRKSVLVDNDALYTNRFGRAEDYHLWLRLIKHGEFANIQEYLFRYRISDKAIKTNYCKETLYDTIRTKLHYLSYASFSACIRLICECMLMLFPERMILLTFLVLQKISLIRHKKDLADP